MSHYTVAVFMPDDKQSVDDLLAPYSEHIEVAPYRKNGELTTYNPNSKWDWYKIGGRWQGELILKSKKKGLRGAPSFKEMSDGYDGAFVRDIDFEAMRKRKATELDPDKKAKKDSFIKEEHINRLSQFSTYAVITPDGEWHAPGKMGWWGVSSETPKDERKWRSGYYDRFIKPAIENNWYMVIVDCHI